MESNNPQTEPQTPPSLQNTPAPPPPPEEETWLTAGFTATGAMLFGLYLSNALLKIITLGMYAPWAKVRSLKLLAHNVKFEGDTLDFHGTGWEMMKGRMVLMGVALPLFIGLGFLGAAHPEWQAFFTLGIYILVGGLFPYLFLAAWRFRLSRTSWRQIHFGLKPEFNRFARRFYKDLVLTVATLGFYGPVLSIRMHRYLWNRIYFGDHQFTTDIPSWGYWKRAMGYIGLTYITGGLFYPFMEVNLIKYKLEYLRFQGHRIRFTGEGDKLLVISITNFLLVLSTLGLGYAWAKARWYRFFVANFQLTGACDITQVRQAEVTVQKAFGEEAADYFDIGL
ncbi:MAG: YjgN family protein [Deltaproteobacteria bacterium]|nr:YjgN family protein [Deltaproteobacteria bacterium]